MVTLVRGGAFDGGDRGDSQRAAARLTVVSLVPCGGVTLATLGGEERRARQRRRLSRRSIVKRRRVAIPPHHPRDTCARASSRDDVRAHLLVHEADEALQRGLHPDVGHVLRRGRALRVGLELGAGVELLPARRVLREEAERVEPRVEDLAQRRLDAVLGEAQRLGAHDGRVDEVEPQRVRAVLVDNELRVRVVLEPLGHLLAVRRKHEPVHDQVLERGLATKTTTKTTRVGGGWVDGRPPPRSRRGWHTVPSEGVVERRDPERDTPPLARRFQISHGSRSRFLFVFERRHPDPRHDARAALMHTGTRAKPIKSTP